MKEFFSGIAILFVVFVFIAVFGFFGNLLGLFSYSFFSPRYEAVRHNTFEQSQSYNEGMIRDLQSLKMQYDTSDDAGKAGIRAIILQRFSAYPNRDQLPNDLQTFYHSLSTH